MHNEQSQRKLKEATGAGLLHISNPASELKVINTLCKEAIKALRQMSDTGGYRRRLIGIVELMIDAAWPLSYPEGTLEIMKEGEGFAQGTGLGIGLAPQRRHRDLLPGKRGVGLRNGSEKLRAASA